MNDMNNCYVLLVQDHSLSIYSKRDSDIGWKPFLLRGRLLIDFTSDIDLEQIISEINSSLHLSNNLRDTSFIVIYAEGQSKYILNFPMIIDRFGCQNWQIFRWEMVGDHLDLFRKPITSEPLKDSDWVTQIYLPQLERISAGAIPTKISTVEKQSFLKRIREYTINHLNK